MRRRHRLFAAGLAGLLGAACLLAAPAATAAPTPRAKPAAGSNAVPYYAPPSDLGEPLNERFRGVNWARDGDNFTTGDLLQDGLSPTDSYAEVYLKSTQTLSSLQTNLHINTVRLGLNEATVAGPWWTNYGAVVRAATDLRMNVILSFWSPSNTSAGSVVPCADGTYNGCYPVSDYAPWWAMWQKVIDTYAGYGNVYMEPFNEAAGYSDAATGYVGPSPTQLADVDAAWLARYPAFPRGRVLLGGSGDDYYLTLGTDPRLDGTLLSYHPYCSFGLSFPTEAAWTSWMRGQLAGMESRTIISEFGLGQSDGTNFDGPRNGNSCVSYVYAVTDLARQDHLGLVNWAYSGDKGWSIAYRTGDGTAASPYVTHVNNPTFVDRLEWGFGFNDPMAPSIGSAAATTFYTGAAGNSFAISTTAQPVARISATDLPRGARLVDHGDGTATLSGGPALVPGSYDITLTARNDQGAATQRLALTVSAGAPPAPSTGVISGRVTDARGRPLAGICEHVFLASSLPVYAGNNYAPATYQACTDATGRYTIPAATPGTARYNVQFIDQRARYQPRWYGDTSGPGSPALKGYNHPGTAITVTAGATTTVDTTMQPIPSGITVEPTHAVERDGGAASWVVSGTITVTNDNNAALTGATVTDAINDPHARCAVADGTGVTIAASPPYPAPLTTATFSYRCSYSAPPSSTHEVDTARVSWAAEDAVPNTSYQYTQPFSF